MEWFSDLTEIVEGLVAWGTMIGWAIAGAKRLLPTVIKALQRKRRRLK